MSRVRWWSSGNTNTWVLPARRRNAAACRMRSRSRSKQVRHGSGSSSTARLPAPWLRVASVASAPSSRSSRARAGEQQVAAAAGPRVGVGEVDAGRRLGGRPWWRPSVSARSSIPVIGTPAYPQAERCAGSLRGSYERGFVDEAQLNVHGGDGGAGCVSFRREGPVAFGGPNGGDGGKGGDVWLVADRNVASLLAFQDHPHRKADNGVHGKGKDMHGKRGEDLEVHVPEGTVVTDLYTGELLADLANHGDRWLAAAGGRGGRGNAKFAVEPAPRPDASPSRASTARSAG